MAKQINEKQTFGHINYESDFVINILIPNEVDDRDVKLDFYTNVDKVVRFTRRNGVLSSNLKEKEDGTLLAIFRRHGLQVGDLWVKAFYTTETDVSPDGEMVDVVPELTRLALVRGIGDMGLTPTIELSLPSFNLPNEPSDDPSKPAFVEVVPEVTPSTDEITTKVINQTVLKFNAPIGVCDAENIKMVTPNGVAFLGYGGGTYSIEDNTLIINWLFDAIEGNYELRIPERAITLANGNFNAVVNKAYSVTQAPVEYFTPTVIPNGGNVTTTEIKQMLLTFSSPIDTFNGSDVRLAKNFGSVWYDYAATGTISDDRLSMTIDWDFAPEVGLTYTLELPEGCITLKNGDKNYERKVAFLVV